MGILVLLTILLIAIRPGGFVLREAGVSPKEPDHICTFAIFKINPANCLFVWTVKLAQRSIYLLNLTAQTKALKGAQTTLIYTEFPTYRG
ncbi:hypothetical protein [Falsiporphyromonas endometrii]|uniref:Secreted protein n=1 Tax=Falsiporphyromonas endometrii TaxID=1387297 RepID=A0ABV9K9H7_9PORP